MNRCNVWPKVREKMLAEADDEPRDRRLNYTEFSALITELSSGALRRCRRFRAAVDGARYMRARVVGWLYG